MKKLLFLVFALATLMQVSAKGGFGTEWGLTAGIRYNGMSLKGAPDGFSVTPHMTYNVGIHASLAFAGIAVQPEINYGYTTLNATYQGFDAKIKAHDVEVPVLLSLRFLPIVRFNVGPVFNIMSKANYVNGNETLMYGGLRPSVGYAAGISLCFLKKLIIDARFVGYFKPAANEFNPYSPVVGDNAINFDTRGYSGGIKVGFLF